jgi:alpha-D-xyloside xylohydrolase
MSHQQVRWELHGTGYNHEIRTRADYIHGTTITARFSSPMPNVIRVQLTHFKGRRARLPAFDLDYSLTNPRVETGSDGTCTWLKAGCLSVVASTSGAWGFASERNGVPLTASKNRAVGLFQQNGKTYLRDQLSLQPGEIVYGLGEHFGLFVKNGQAIDSWNEDGATNKEIA